MWFAETIRLTVFQQVPVNLEEINWWAEVVGANPPFDNIVRKVGERKQEGPFSNGILKLEITPGRIDWVFSSVTNIDGELPARLGDTREKTSEFINLFTDWLASRTNINRLAFGLILVAPHNNHAAAYEHLNSCLPHIKLQTESSDFLYQINRPQTLEINNLGELKFNRLSRWHAVKGGVIAEVEGVKQEREFYASTLELDINTDAKRVSEFPSELLTPITNKLVELAIWITENGDVE